MNTQYSNDRERGAALMTVIVASLLLGTACIALLSAVGYSSRNNTDALNEAKAYWAAESGLQATINYLRNTPNMTYSQALNNQAGGTLPVSAGNVGTETAYTVQISNPDGGLAYRFYTGGSFRPPVPTTSPTPPPVAEARVSPPSICIPNCNVATVNRTEISFTPQTTELTVAFPNTANYNLGTFRVDYFGTGAATIPAGITFKIEYYITSPRAASRTIRGTVAPNNSAGSGVPVGLAFDSQLYELIGSQLEVCGSATPTGTVLKTMCTDVTISLSSANPTRQVYINASPAEPYRLLVTSTGSGPMRAQKKLEGMIVKDLINGFPYTAALTMLGPGANLDFEQGTGNPIYCGYDQGYQPGDTIPPNAPCTPNTTLPSAPSIGVSDQTGLEEVYSDLSNPLPNPPPDILTDGPDWQYSAAAMHEFITTLKNRAMQGSTGSLYIPDTNGAAYTSLPDPTGNFNDGTGLTFCEGNCTAGPIDGGGILVVNGNFTYNGNFDFRGTIIVIGSMERLGAGNGSIVGGVIIAPYDPNNLAAGFQSPSFTTNGGGTSDIIFSGDFGGFDGTNAVTNVMIGVAEK